MCLSLSGNKLHAHYYYLQYKKKSDLVQINTITVRLFVSHDYFQFLHELAEDVLR